MRAPIVAVVVLGVLAAACGGTESEDTGSTLPTAVGESAAGASDSWDQADGPGAVVLRPVLTCADDTDPDASAGEAVLPHLGDEDPCTVGPAAGTGQIFERNGAVAAYDDVAAAWVVDVRLRAAGQVVFAALAERCFARTDECSSGRIAIVLDDVIQSAPVVQSTTFEDVIQISGRFTESQARRLAAAINQGTPPGDEGDDSEAAESDTAATDTTVTVAPAGSAPTTVAPTTAPADSTEDSAGYAMPAVCGLPAATWTTNEHPDSQDPGPWATGSRDEGDLDGDGEAETVWATVCGEGTVAAERAVHVFDSDLELMGTLPVETTVAEEYPDRTVHALEPRIADDEIEVEVWVWQPSDATCCPSVTFALSFVWDGIGFAPTSQVPDPTAASAPAGETAVVDWDGVYRPAPPGRVVRLGQFGRQVELLQQALDQRGYDVDVDGYFGPGTEAAVRRFQIERGLPVTGVASDDVWDQFGE